MKNLTHGKWTEAWNSKDIDFCSSYFDENIELRSTLLARLFPESGGVIKGKELVTKYFRYVVVKFPEIKFSKISFKENEDSFILNASNGGTVNTYAEYFMNKEGLVYLIKADVSEDYL